MSRRPDDGVAAAPDAKGGWLGSVEYRKVHWVLEYRGVGKAGSGHRVVERSR